MAKIYAPNKNYTGISASVGFVNGVGETSDPHLISWFENHGYTVEKTEEETEGEKVVPEKPDPVNFEEMTAEQLIAYAEEKGIDIGKATSQEGILKKIQEAEASKE